MAKLKQRMLDPIPFTKEGYANVQAEFDALTEKRKELVDHVRVAREFGDLSENAAYHEARKNLFDADKRLRQLKMQLIYGIVSDNTSDEIVQLGSTVVVESGDGDQAFMIVGEFEANPVENKISHKSPIGKALLGKKVGDSVEIIIPIGTKIYTIKAVRP